MFITIEDQFVRFLNNLQEANEFLEQPTVVFSAIEKFRIKQRFFETSEVKKFGEPSIHTSGFLETLLR